MSCFLEQRSRTGIFHDRFHLILENRLITMLWAFPAFRFRIQRTQNPHDNGVAQQPCAFTTNSRAMLNDSGQLFIFKCEGSAISIVVVGVAVHMNETHQFRRVVLDFLGGSYYPVCQIL